MEVINPWDNKELLGLFVSGSINQDFITWSQEGKGENNKNCPLLLWVWLHNNKPKLKNGNTWMVADSFFTDDRLTAVISKVAEGKELKHAILETWK